MTHERFVRTALCLIFIALVGNIFRPQIQQLLGGAAAAQGQEAVSGGELHVTGDLIVDGSVVVKKDIRSDQNLIARGDVQAGRVAADQLNARSSTVSEDLGVSRLIKCQDISVEKMLSARNAQIAQALSADNIAVARDMQVTGTAFIENIAVRELKGPNDVLDASRPKIIDEIVARTIAALRTIERP